MHSWLGEVMLLVKVVGGTAVLGEGMRYGGWRPAEDGMIRVCGALIWCCAGR